MGQAAMAAEEEQEVGEERKAQELAVALSALPPMTLRGAVQQQRRAPRVPGPQL